MDQYIDAILTGDSGRIVEQSDCILQIFNSIERDNKWKYLILNKVESSKKYFKNIDQILIKNYDKDSKYLEPWDLRTIGLNKANFDYKFKDMARINGFTKCWNSIIMFGLIFGKKYFESEVTKMFTQYLELFPAEPFYEQSDGGIILQPYCYDASVSLRVKLFIRCIWEEMTGKLESDILFETFNFLFQNPQKHTTDLKNMKAPFLSCAYTSSNTGESCAWTDSTLTSFIAKKMPIVNRDITTMLRLNIDGDLEKKRDEMTEKGMPKLAQKFYKMMSDKVDYKGMSDFSTYWFLEAVSGIMRSNYPKTVLESVDETDPSFAPDNKMKYHYFDIWYKFFTSYVETIPDKEEQYVLECISDLTTRSNGLNQKIVIDGELVDNPDAFVFKIDVGLHGKKEISWAINDKAMTFRVLLADPNELFDYYRMVKSLSPDDPGRLFARYVPARLVRMVYGVPIWRFLTERFVREMVNWLAKQTYPEAMSGKKMYPISTLAIDTGRYMTEMGPYLYYTGNFQLWVRILLADMSAFDQSQAFKNWRLYAIEALKKVMIDCASVLETKRYKILGGRHPLEYLLGNWETLEHAMFRLYLSLGESVLIEADWTLSGEFATMVTNTSASWAYVKAVMDELEVREIVVNGKKCSLIDFIKFEQFKLQGDDQIAILPPVDLNLSLEDQLLVEMEFMKLLEDVASSGHLKISVNKTGFRTGHFEFLKKAGMWGYAIPRFMQVSLEESENINRLMDPIERMRSRLGQYREYEFRGGSTVYGLIRRYMEWNLIRSVKFTGEEKDFSSYLPFELIWTPVSDGGVGMHPITNVDPNCDIMIALYDWHPQVKYNINLCIYALKTVPSKNNDFIVSQVMDHLRGGIDVEKSFDNTVNHEKIIRSEAAYESLKKKGMKDDHSAYFKRYNQEVKEAIEDDKKIEKINVQWKMEKADHIIKVYNSHPDESNQVHDYLKDKFIPGVSFEEGDLIRNSSLPFCPIAGLDSNLQMWFQQIGTSSEEKIITGDGFSALSKLLSYGNFPRNLKANSIENIASDLLRYGFTSEVDIAEFLIMRGAEEDGALRFAKIMANKMEMMIYLSNISTFSFVGEGFTDKSAERIFQLVKFVESDLDNSTAFAQMIKSVGYQFMRTRPLWTYENGIIKPNPRRIAMIRITEETKISFLMRYAKSENNIGIYDQMLRDALFSTSLRYNADEE